MNETHSYPENFGKHSLGLINDQGERLLNFCALNHLAVMIAMQKRIDYLDIFRRVDKELN